jgi:hypothetical protein
VGAKAGGWWGCAAVVRALPAAVCLIMLVGRKLFWGKERGRRGFDGLKGRDYNFFMRAHGRETPVGKESKAFWGG